MRLAHCSDLHLLSLEGARVLDFANKRWIGGLNLLTSRSRHHHTEAFEDMVVDFAGQGIDHVVCTGDLTNVALEQEFRYARGYFDRIGLGSVGVTVIPGNHDTYVAAGAEHFAALFGDYCTADDGWAWSDGDGGVEDRWPVIRVRGQVAVIALSTSLQTPWFTAWGRVGERQLERLGRALGDPRLRGLTRVVAIHHPPAGKRATSRIRGLRDHEGLAAVLAAHGAELVLHGHEHQDLSETLTVPGGTVPVLGVQSGTYLAHRPERTARYRIFEVGSDGTISHHLRVWHRDRRVFVDDVPGANADAVTA